jgi:hypothetical protein
MPRINNKNTGLPAFAYESAKLSEALPDAPHFENCPFSTKSFCTSIMSSAAVFASITIFYIRQLKTFT